MKNFCLGLATLLLGGSLAYGDTPGSQYDPLLGSAEPVVTSEPVTGLTPRGTKTPVAVAQQPAKQIPAPVIPQASALSDAVRLAQVSNDFELAPVIPAQHVEVPPPAVTPTFVHAPASGGTDSYLYAELERLSEEVQKIKKDTAKPDTKKGWSAPKVAGRIFVDSVNFIDQNTTSREIVNGNMPNAAGFRELRIGASGSGYDSFDYKVEFAFHQRGGTVSLTDNWMGIKNLPLLGYVRAGHFKPETGLYYTMSPSNASAMEYITPTNVFGLGRRIGISSENLFANDRIRLFFGVFQGAATADARYLDEDNQGQTVNLRLTAAPWFAQDGKCVLHLGGHWEYVGTDSKSFDRVLNSRTATFSARPGTFSWADATLRTGTFANDYSHRGGVEFAYQNGRFSTRSELHAGSFSADGQPGRHLYGAYVELAYFLTDDFRSYNLKSGLFGAPKVKQNFHPFNRCDWNLVDGFGAWQAVFQWGYTDMEDWRGGTNIGGHQNDFVAALNWFWSPQMRWVFEYVHSRQNVGADHLRPSQDIFGTSLRYDW